MYLFLMVGLIVNDFVEIVGVMFCGNLRRWKSWSGYGKNFSVFDGFVLLILFYDMRYI